MRKPTAISAGADVELGEAVGGNPTGVLDDEAIHIDDPERPVGTGSDLHGAEPVVGRGKEFGFFFALGAMAAEGDALLLEHQPMDRQAHRTGDGQPQEGAHQLGARWVVGSARDERGPGKRQAKAGQRHEQLSAGSVEREPEHRQEHERGEDRRIGARGVT